MIVIDRSEIKCDYIKGNISDVYNNVYYEADGSCVCIDVETWMDLRCSDVNII